MNQFLKFRWRRRTRFSVIGHQAEYLEVRSLLTENPMDDATAAEDSCDSSTVEQFIKENGIVPRGNWGARPPNGVGDPPGDYTTIVIHHSGNGGETDPKQIQNQHMDKKGFDDIGYHFMIDPRGVIYEGRSLDTKGSHVEGANTGKVGILIMGDFQPGGFLDFSDDKPTAEQLTKAAELIEALKDLYPTITTLGGHKDFKPSTECPGDDLYKILPKLADETDLKLPPPPAPPPAPTYPPKPNLPATIFGPYFDPKMGA